MPARIVGGLIVVLALVSGARDLGIGLDNCDSYMKVKRGEPLPSLHSDLYYPIPEPTIRTGVLTMSLAALNLLKQ